MLWYADHSISNHSTARCCVLSRQTKSSKISAIIFSYDEEWISIFENYFQILRIDSVSTTTIGETCNLCSKILTDFVLLDSALPQYDGIYAAKYLKQRNSNIKIILSTSECDVHTRRQFEELSIPIVSKPINLTHLSQTIQKITKNVNLD